MNARKLKKLENELISLTGRLDRLAVFMLSDTFNALSDQEQRWLREQRAAMELYEDVLIKRVNYYNLLMEKRENAENKD